MPHDHSVSVPHTPPPAVALVVAGGSGTRLGGDVPKQYLRLGGCTLLAHAVAAFGDMPVYVVIAAGEEARARQAVSDLAVAAWVIGGAERQDSVRNGLEAIAANGGAERVLVHDAARPGVTRDLIDRLIAALDEAPGNERADGAVPVLTVPDSVARLAADGERLGQTVDRAGLVRVQTPQAFRFAPLLAAVRAHHARAGAALATDEAGLALAAGLKVVTVAGNARFDKITTTADLVRAKDTMERQMISRSATGFDVHRIVEGGQLWLGGVVIAHDLSLAGHSDADVALHALTDALLGTIAAGDIGTHFPPSDPQWRGAASHQFLTHARDLITARGGVIDHVDLTIICEAPKIGPHREAIRARIGALLALDADQVGIKATTTERLGFTGRGEGMAAQACATVRLPKAERLPGKIPAPGGRP